MEKTIRDWKNEGYEVDSWLSDSGENRAMLNLKFSKTDDVFYTQIDLDLSKVVIPDLSDMKSTRLKESTHYDVPKAIVSIGGFVNDVVRSNQYEPNLTNQPV